MTTNKVKRIRPNKSGFLFFKYGISKQDQISIDHILSLILYCDFTEYSTAFSRTFRKLSYSESMYDVKERNSSFYHQSKFFREVVECFGKCGDGKQLSDGRKGELGPFYSGVDAVLAIPEFSIRLRSPTSTSKHIEVSLKFATRDGIVIELMNASKGKTSKLPFFDVRVLFLLYMMVYDACI